MPEPLTISDLHAVIERFNAAVATGDDKAIAWAEQAAVCFYEFSKQLRAEKAAA